MTNCRPTRDGRLSVNPTTQRLRRRMDGLDLIYSVSFFIAFSYTHFASLDTPDPLLHHSALISTFIDIWNSIDRSFSLLPLRTSIFIVIVTTTVDKPIPPLSPPLLRSHFPCLSLYNPFATAVPTTTSVINDLGIPPTATRPNPLYDAKFSRPRKPALVVTS